MHSNRTPRNAQQLRSIIQTMGRSIDEARSKRIGPSTPQAPTSAPARHEVTPPQEPHTPPVSGAAPPIRGANEMFVEGGQRLKAKPKKAS